MSLRDIASPDGNNWTKPEALVNGYTGYGHQMAVFRGQLWGIMTQTVQYPHVMFANRFENGKWNSSWITVSKGRASGRVAVAVMDGRFYICFRGLDTRVYIMYTEDMANWTDPVKVTSGGETTAAPLGLEAFQGNLYIHLPGLDEQLYYATVDKDLNVTQRWTGGMNGQSYKSPAMAVYDGKLYALHTSRSADAVFVKSISKTGGSWSGSWQKVDGDVASGVTAVAHSDNKLYVAYRSSDKSVRWNVFDGKSWKGEQKTSVQAAAEVGLSSWGGALHISYSSGGDSLLPEASNGYETDSDDGLEHEKHQAVLAPSKKPSRLSWLAKLRCF